MSLLRPFLPKGSCVSLSLIQSRASSAAASLRDVLTAELDGIREAGTWKSERVITTPQAASIRVQERDGAVLNFCANNYLGLSVSEVLHCSGRHCACPLATWVGLVCCNMIGITGTCTHTCSLILRWLKPLGLLSTNMVLASALWGSYVEHRYNISHLIPVTTTPLPQVKIIKNKHFDHILHVITPLSICLLLSTT